MSKFFLLPIIPAVILGTLNWIYWKRKGYNSINQLIIGILLFYAGIYMILRKVY